MRKNTNKKILLLITLLLLVLSAPLTVAARAGGGGRSSSGGGSSSGGSSHHSSSHSYSSSSRRYNNGSHRSSPISGMLNVIPIAIIAFGGTAVFTYRRVKAKSITKKNMKFFAENGNNWDYKEIQPRVKEAYFKIQECWRRNDVDYAADFLSQNMHTSFQSKLEWMDIRNERAVQKNVRLISASPVFAEDREGVENDRLWYLIHGKMTGYYIDKNTRRVVRGSLLPESFYEYWVFVYENGRWVLDEILQKNEVDIKQFTHVE